MSGILLVEDDPDLRLMLRVVLERIPDCDVTGEALDAHEAIEAAGNLKPFLIILDHSLGGAMTGLEVAPMLRAAAPNAHILLFSAYDLSREAAAEPAIDGFLRKDSVQTLRSTIEKIRAVA